MFLFQVFLVILTQYTIHSEVVITIHILEETCASSFRDQNPPPKKKNWKAWYIPTQNPLNCRTLKKFFPSNSHSSKIST